MYDKAYRNCQPVPDLYCIHSESKLEEIRNVVPQATTFFQNPVKYNMKKKMQKGVSTMSQSHSLEQQKPEKTKQSGPAKAIRKIPISEEEFLRKIEKMYSEYAIEEIRCHMKSDFRYNSFWVFEEMKSAARYVDYITQKIQTLERENIVIKTRMMHIRGTGQPCLVLRQPGTEPICLIAERSPKGLIARMDMMPAGFYKLVPCPGED